MAEYINRRRNIFINSEQYHQSNGDVKLIFPGVDFAVDKNEIMRLSLESFTMQRRFYNINTNNNTFYIRNTLGNTYQEVKLQSGDYGLFESNSVTGSSLCQAIKAAIDVIFAGSVVTYESVTRFITIDMRNATGWLDTQEFVCFQIPPGRTGTNPSVNITESGKFNDSCEILGAVATKSFDAIKSAFEKTGTTKMFTSFYPASLYTLEAIHLTTNLQTHSYQTPNFAANSESSLLVPCDIFAKIPVLHHDNMLSQAPKLISYIDSGSDAYAVDLQNKSLNHIILSLRDDKGRKLPSIGDQSKDGNLSFLATLKWCAVRNLETGNISGFPQEDSQMRLYQLSI